MQIFSRNGAMAALACLLAVASAAPLPAAAQQTAPGTVLLWRHMFGTIDGAKLPTGGIIYSVGDDGSNLRQLTPRQRGVFNIPRLYDWWPANAFSPSGDYSVFLREQSDLAYPDVTIHAKYYVLDTRGRTWPLFPSADDLQPPGYGSVTWGPAGTDEIAYANSADNYPHRHPACVHLMHPNGTGDHTLWCASRWNFRAIQGLRWSGDGRILLAYAVHSDGLDSDLYEIDTATGAATLLMTDVNMPKNGGAVADLSHDGHELLYQVSRNAPGACSAAAPSSVAEVWCARNLQTGEVVPLLDPDNQVIEWGNRAVISPDGSQAVLSGIARGTGGDMELYVVNTDGTGLRKISSPCVDDYPANGTQMFWYAVRFSPDGRQVLGNCEYYARQYPPPPDTGPRKIYVINLADGSARFVTYGTAYDWHVPSL